MGLSWQQGPLAPGATGRFLVPDPLPERLLYAEPLRRRMRVRFGGTWIADSGEHSAPRGAWQHIDLPAHASEQP
jgi:hypothetical protein